jgi:hypothetical protein
VGTVVRDTIFNGGRGKKKIHGYEGSQAVPARPSDKGGTDTKVKQDRKINVALLYSIGMLNSDIKLWKAASGSNEDLRKMSIPQRKHTSPLYRSVGWCCLQK